MNYVDGEGNIFRGSEIEPRLGAVDRDDTCMVCGRPIHGCKEYRCWCYRDE
jgi:hypothetical protein